MSNVEAEPLDRVNLSKKLKQRLDHLDHRFDEVDRRLDEMEYILKHGTNKILRALNEQELFDMATQADLDAVSSQLNDLATNLTADDSAIQSEIAALQAANPSLDLTGVKAAVDNLAAGVAATQALVPAPEPAPAPTPVVNPEPVTPSPEPAPDQPTPTPDQPTA